MSKTELFLAGASTNSAANPLLPAATTHPLSFPNVILSMVVAAILSYILSAYYVRYGKSLSNRAILAKDFVLITLTTTLIITIVKSSLALSLGLVGALSIVRFRAAIKEPEELAYLFLTISLGLGCGADQWKITIVSFFLILILIHVRTLSSGSNYLGQSLFIDVEIAENKHQDWVDKLIETLKSSSDLVDLRRLDARGKLVHATFLVQLKPGASIQNAISNIQKLDSSANISFVDQTQRAEL